MPIINVRENENNWWKKNDGVAATLMWLRLGNFDWNEIKSDIEQMMKLE